jgi:hypothetical protein
MPSESKRGANQNMVKKEPRDQQGLLEDKPNEDVEWLKEFASKWLTLGNAFFVIVSGLLIYFSFVGISYHRYSSSRDITLSKAQISKGLESTTSSTIGVGSTSTSTSTSTPSSYLGSSFVEETWD